MGSYLLRPCCAMADRANAEKPRCSNKTYFFQSKNSITIADQCASMGLLGAKLAGVGEWPILDD
ncbi:hypothetical protein [Methylomicrobium album]|uniref:hypothetical protein n=1 Tax=Methylomicrobium album TaxID=39775 RepID=UPI001BC899B5|nr:hypothetical protein [Methylomicrobium album]